MNTVLGGISAALQSGRAKTVKELVEQALSEGVPPKEILEQGLLAGMDAVAVKFKNDEIYIPEVLIAARAMTAGMEPLKPDLAQSGAKPIGKALLGTVKGDLHDIGKNLVRMMLEGKGVEVVDLGVDVPPERFVAAYKEHNADIVALSALLTTTMGEMENTVKAFAAEGLRDKVTIMVGGAPVTDRFREKIGADLYAADAASAAEAAKQAILARRP